MAWYHMLEDYYGVTLANDKGRRWLGELQADITGLDDTELAEAIKASTFRDRPKYAGKPTLQDLRIWVFMLRKASREDREGPRVESCAMCHGGWLTVYPRLPANPQTLVEFALAYDVAVPCRCTGGQTILETCVDYDRADPDTIAWLARLTDLGMLQRAAWLRLIEAENVEVE